MLLAIARCQLALVIIFVLASLNSFGLPLAIVPAGLSTVMILAQVRGPDLSLGIGESTLA